MVVEKIGTELQLVKLHNHKIRRGQGYLFGERVKASTYLALSKDASL